MQPSPGWSVGPPAVRPPLVAPASGPAPRWALAIALFLATFFTTTTLGAHWVLAAKVDALSPLPVGLFGALLTPETIAIVWSDPALVRHGLAFSLPLLFILLCHELGHYIACRRYRLHATLPYFVPVPVGLGTFGAFIRIRSLIRNRTELLDVGVAGPIAGFAALLPFLVYGVARSRVAPVQLADDTTWAGVSLLLPGRSVALELLTRLFHGTVPAGHVLEPHPFVIAAWFGLLATALNLLPLGQLDGGHLLYAVFRRHHRWVARAFWAGMVVMGAALYGGWVVWALLVLLIVGLGHPPLLDEHAPLKPGRIALAVVALVLFVVSFMPVPIEDLPVIG